MGSYFRRPEMMNGKGLRCYNCGKLLAIKLEGSNYEVRMKCPRCKAKIKIEMSEPIDWKKKKDIEVKQGDVAAI